MNIVDTSIQKQRNLGDVFFHIIVIVRSLTDNVRVVAKQEKEDEDLANG